MGSNADYIKREDATRWNPANKDKREYGTYFLDDAYETGYEDKIKQIEQIPAADVRENVHGEWIGKGKMGDVPCCSVCGRVRFGSGLGFVKKYVGFCEWCGADMRGEPYF